MSRDNPLAAKITRHSYLVAQAALNGAPLMLALEAVASTAIEHPEWDMEEERTWEEWHQADA